MARPSSAQQRPEVFTAAGLLEQVTEETGHATVRVTTSGIAHLALSIQRNRQNRSAHEILVDRIGQEMLPDGRVVWTGLGLRAGLTAGVGEPIRWKMCRPDVFSIRNTTVASYPEPIVHEIKVSRADLLGDLKCKASGTATSTLPVSAGMY